MADFFKRWPLDRAPVILGVTCALALIALVAWLGLPAWVLLAVALPWGCWGVYALVRHVRFEQSMRLLKKFELQSSDARAIAVITKHAEASGLELQALVHEVIEGAKNEPQPDTILVSDPDVAATLQALNKAHAEGDTERVWVMHDAMMSQLGVSVDES